jgi:hypothetical protein
MTAEPMFGEIQGRGAMLEPRPATSAESERHRARDLDRRLTAHLVDDTLEGSFPASDPPSWTSSIATLAPAPAGTALAPSSTSCGESRRYSEVLHHADLCS